ncbi:efflux RND transporter permease subunit [Leadbettera azotonutricia]|uniref:Acriflavine resistance protein n=1 Tax=Leadbettera azotonutricia (strain ATCC BAA-888 / DSM 13862 / ZAS-9) TaxID=545695 RepID=F5YC04_LEAAZ|nr:efflux RND transporter permease subunit [Leadbettera azotonutricia]AEF81426.1 acriflavine resistance protein [Leadbettera azotonutricia ZAS-9]
MSLAKSVVSRPTTVFIIFVLLIMLGVFAFINLPIDLMPEINPPYLVVYTSYPGAGPEEVERSVTRPLEAALSSASSLEKVTSTSSKGTSMVIMQFTYGTDLADASNSVRDSLERTRNYMPTGAQSPMIFKFDPSMIPIMGLMVTGNRSPEELRQIAEDTIVPRIEQTPGVATASVSGGREKIIRVEIPQSRLEAYGLTVTAIQQMLAAQNAQVAAGTITEDGLSYLLTTMGEYTSLDQIRNTVISYKAVSSGQELPRSVYLRDIANVYEGYRDETSIVYVNGVSAVMLMVQKQSGKNSVQTAKDLRVRLERIAREIPQDIKISELFNTTDQIENSINQVGSTAVSGALLAVIVLFIFLRSIKPTLIIGISIPVSIIITIMLMYFAHLTLNLMTLAGLILGVGMLVDNSIVILENIYHYREKGAKLSTASVIGTQEMIVAIVASTLTTICVFAPLVMFQGLLEMAGEMFSGLAFTVVISLTSSLLIAMFLVPVLSSHYLPLVTRKQKPLKSFLAPVDRAFENFFTRLDNNYRKAVAWVLHHKAITIGFLAALLVGSIALIPVIGWVFMPEQEADSVSVNVTLPMGTPLAETEATLQQIQRIVEREVQGYDRIMLNAGGSGGMMGSGGANSGSVRINLPKFEERIDSADEIKAKIRTHFNEFPGVTIYFSAGGMSMGSGNPVDVILRTDNLVKGKVMADQIAKLLKDNLPDITEPRVDLQDGLPQIEIELDRERIYALGLNTYTIGNEIKAAVDGVTATRYKEGGTDYDVILILAEADRSTKPALDHIFVNSQVAGKVPLSNFARYVEGTGPMTIRRENQSRVIHITAGAQPGTKLNQIEERVRNIITANVPADDEVLIEYGGDNAEMMKMMKNFALILVVAACLVFGVMACLFESFRDPFIVIFTIPLSVIGIVAIYLITGDAFNILTAVGLLVLVGVIVNNGIVLVDYTNLLRKRGYSLHDACVEAAGNRLRPILMTTLTTVLGLLPMAFLPGEGSELVAPIGKTVLGGLSFGTLMTLFLMPTVYFLMNRSSDQRAAKAEAKRERIAAGLSRKEAKAKASSSEGTDTEAAKVIDGDVQPEGAGI